MFILTEEAKIGNVSYVCREVEKAKKERIQEVIGGNMF